MGSQGSRLLLARGLNQPLLASAGSPVNCGYDGVAGDCITSNTAQNAGLRVPIMGETPTALAANEFSGASAYHSLQVTLGKQIPRTVWPFRPLTLTRVPPLTPSSITTRIISR